MKWFKSKSRNRRREREHLLDVKLRSQQLRTARMRFGGLVLAFLFVATVTVLVLWRGGEYLLDRFLYQNEAFAIQRIDVSTDGVIDTARIQAWALIKPRENLLALDLGRVKRDLELVPVLREAFVERVLPNTLRIRVSERTPIAQLPALRVKPAGGVEQTVFHIDETGFVFQPLDSRFRAKPVEGTPEYLPVISGVDPRELQPGRRMDSRQILAAIELVTEFEYSSMFGLTELQKIDVSTPEVLNVHTSQGSEVSFALTNFEQQLRRWRVIHDKTTQWRQAITWLDLSVANNLPLRVVPVPVESAIENTTKPKNTKTPRTRKRHV